MFKDYKKREDRLGKEDPFFVTYFVDLLLIGILGAMVAGFLTVLI